MKPFNVEDALNGAPVCTRDGRPVTQLVKFDCDDHWAIFGVVNKRCVSWSRTGQAPRSALDLFMAPLKKNGWVAREKYTDNNVDFVYGMIYPSEESAKMNCPNALGFHKIEWEE